MANKLYRVSDPAGPETVEAANATAAFTAVHGMRPKDVFCATDLGYADPLAVDMLETGKDYVVLRFERLTPISNHLEIEVDLVDDPDGAADRRAEAADLAYAAHAGRRDGAADGAAGATRDALAGDGVYGKAYEEAYRAAQKGATGRTVCALDDEARTGMRAERQNDEQH